MSVSRDPSCTPYSGVGRPFKDIPRDAPGALLAEYLRHLVELSGLTTREIGQLAHTGHTTISQNLDGRLPKHWETVAGTIRAIFKALDVAGRDIGWTPATVANHARVFFDYGHGFPPATEAPRAGDQVVEFDLYRLADQAIDQRWGRVIPLPRSADADIPMTAADVAEHVAALYDCAEQTGVDLAEVLRLLLTEEARRRAPGTGADGSAGAGG
jgi:hypothetical protein